MEDNVDTVIAKYGKRAPKKPSKGRIVIISALVLIISAGLAIGGLELFKSKPTATTPTPVADVSGGPTAEEIVTKIAADPTIAAVNNYSVLHTNTGQSDGNSNTSSVIYPQNGYNFLTNAAAEDGLAFTLNDKAKASSKTTITGAIKNVLTTAGFTQTNQDVSALSAYSTVTYTNKGTVCQVVDFGTGGKQTSVLEQAVLCASHAGLEASYKNVQTLLAKAGPTVASSAKTVSQTTTVDANSSKKLLTLIVTPASGKDSTQYYFATLDKDYEYLGNRPTPSVDNAASYTLSDQLKTSISDPKWGTFLTDNIK